MSAESYHFKVGTFECILVNDGTLAYTEPASVHFANAPLDRLEQALHAYNIQLDQWKEWISPLPCLVIKTGEHLVLVDTGLGHIDWGPNAGKLLTSLQSEGIMPDDIDTVILTHAHGDHIGGTTDSEGNAAFPKAQYFLRKEEWDFWTSETTLAHPDHNWMTFFVDRNLLPIKDRVRLVEQDKEIVPGIHNLFAPGHTPGNMALAVVSGGEQLLCLGDIITHPIHLEQPEWHISPDCDPKQSVLTRRRLLRRAADDHTLIFAFHFDFPGLGYAHAQEEAWKWQSYQ